MNLSIDADQETVRTAYIELVKKVHPDSGHTDASADRFQQVDNAFRVLQAKFAKERRNIHDGDERASTEEIKKFDIRVNVILQFNYNLCIRFFFVYNSIQHLSIGNI